MPQSDAQETSLTDFFNATIAGYDKSNSPAADVTIQRGAELIRLDRDGRAPHS